LPNSCPARFDNEKSTSWTAIQIERSFETAL
jgi:hypothetical protein